MLWIIFITNRCQNDDIMWIYLWNTVEKVKISAVGQMYRHLMCLKQAHFHAGDFVIVSLQ